jgi:hypothetical protein
MGLETYIITIVPRLALVPTQLLIQYVSEGDSHHSPSSLAKKA